MKPEEVMSYILQWEKEGKYGNIQVNFCGGKIPNINLNESIKAPPMYCDSMKTIEVVYDSAKK